MNCSTSCVQLEFMAGWLMCWTVNLVARVCVTPGCDRVKHHFFSFSESTLVQSPQCLSHFCMHTMHQDSCTCSRSHVHLLIREA